MFVRVMGAVLGDMVAVAALYGFVLFYACGMGGMHLGMLCCIFVCCLCSAASSYVVCALLHLCMLFVLCCIFVCCLCSFMPAACEVWMRVCGLGGLQAEGYKPRYASTYFVCALLACGLGGMDARTDACVGVQGGACAKLQQRARAKPRIHLHSKAVCSTGAECAKLYAARVRSKALCSMSARHTVSVPSTEPCGEG